MGENELSRLARRGEGWEPYPGAATPTVGIAEGAMFSTDYWRQAAAAFRELQPPRPTPGIAQRHEDNGICAVLNDSGFGITTGWRLSNANKPTIALFRDRARSAAIRLGYTGDAEGAISFWLDMLREWCQQGSDGDDGLYFREVPGGVEVYRVCDASAAYCLKCDTEAFAEERAVLTNRRLAAKDSVSAVDHTGVAKPKGGESTAKARKRGPKPDYESAAHVAEIVKRVAPEGDWRSKVDGVGEALDHGVCDASSHETCEALDHKKIPLPRGWRKKHNDWLNPPDRATLVKAIEYRLDSARREPITETLS